MAPHVSNKLACVPEEDFIIITFSAEPVSIPLPMRELFISRSSFLDDFSLLYFIF